MNRTDRLLAIVLELQGKGRQRAEDLAATFETSKRTIYRDMQALGQAGVPLVSLPGRGYGLIDGYFLPPVSFTTAEATMLLLGSDAMAQYFDAHYREAAVSASRKIAGVLPAKRRSEVQALRDSIHFVSGAGTLRDPAETRLQLLRGALLDCLTVQFRYHARRSDPATAGAGLEGGVAQRREVDPYRLAHVGGAWYVVGYDHSRRAQRTFRLDRIEDLAVTTQTFTAPPSESITRPTRDATAQQVVRVLFDAAVTRWVREAPSFFAVADEERPDGLLVTLQVRSDEDVLQWLLGWGRHAQVVEPDSLRQRLLAEAEAMREAYSIGPPTLVYAGQRTTQPATP